MQKIYDVAIVGGGPAGATAALKLAKAGAAVILLEKENIPRYKTCGGGVVYRARSLIEVDISNAVERELHVARVGLLSIGAHFETRRSRPLISMTMRATLDHVLMLAAERAGAALQPQTEVRSLSFSRDSVNVQTANGAVTAKFIIGADGADSTVAKCAGWKESRMLIPAIEAEMYLPDPQFAALSGKARFDFDIPRRGYAWVFPKRDHLSLGVLSVTGRNAQLKTAFTQYCDVIGIKRVLMQERHGFVIPVAPRRDGFARNRLLLVGDAAGFADPVTAEGISYAVQSGQLAADALMKAKFDVRHASMCYETMVRKAIAPELKAARLLAKVLYGSPSLRRWVFRRYGNALTETVADIFMGERTYHGAISNPSNYLRLLSHRNRSVETLPKR
jgi:geranylgeranyl reductase family protein